MVLKKAVDVEFSGFSKMRDKIKIETPFYFQ